VVGAACIVVVGLFVPPPWPGWRRRIDEPSDGFAGFAGAVAVERSGLRSMMRASPRPSFVVCSDFATSMRPGSMASVWPVRAVFEDDDVGSE
jgi:hypothetical protein